MFKPQTLNPKRLKPRPQSRETLWHAKRLRLPHETKGGKRVQGKQGSGVWAYFLGGNSWARGTFVVKGLGQALMPLVGFKKQVVGFPI